MREYTYQVRLPVFEGPLDLLLNLVEGQELDITLISLAQVTDQYLTYLRTNHGIAPEELTGFVAVAARLLLIKSRVLLPQPKQSEEDDEDIGEELVLQLREYKLFRQLAQMLGQRDQESLHAYPRMIPFSRWNDRRDLKLSIVDTSLEDLRTALYALFQEQAQDAPQATVERYAVTIGDKIKHIDRLLSEKGPLSFAHLLEDVALKMEIIVTLLAVLELIRARQISVRQDRLFGEIIIQPLRTSF